ncbi:T9SS type A sorting domain-containing protein [Carboxylicivirga sediminis]|uniref:T9SS type A sorting domain-containing protein n=1 Tax=Carboxylicivirga sediminis TaxID=2006564 RepID=A0A941F6Z1_9BACT|nr:T9SS type A sorting domain-containing protein [Carboxylicivirga sediminis]MBR8537888.1 T9SS type A sorting domain-containing protein [Carboxylicivirga sediminis]
MKQKLLSAILYVIITPMLFAQVPQSERDALVTLFNSTDGHNWRDNSNWNSSKSVNEWLGITVKDGHVTEIELANNMLKGPLPKQIGEFPMLESLNLWKNNLNGTIPEELGNCTRLVELFLDENELTGAVPSSLRNLTAMTNFWLDGNQLSGDITGFFSEWTQLVYFGIGGGNDFTGYLDLSQNPSLIACWINDSNISGLNIKNGNNINIPNDHFQAHNSPNLTCVIVDDTQYSVANWLNIDDKSLFVNSEAECNTTSIENEKLETPSVYPNPTTGVVYINSSEPIDLVRVYDILGQKIIERVQQGTIDLSSYGNGIYFIVVERSDRAKYTFKVLKK